MSIQPSDGHERLAELEHHFLRLVAAFEALRAEHRTLRAEHNIACLRLGALELERATEQQAAA